MILAAIKKWRQDAVAAKVRQHALRVNEEERRKQDADARHKAAMIHLELGYNIESDAQGWARNAELMKQYRDDIASLQSRVDALERRQNI